MNYTRGTAVADAKNLSAGGAMTVLQLGHGFFRTLIGGVDARGRWISHLSSSEPEDRSEPGSGPCIRSPVRLIHRSLIGMLTAMNSSDTFLGTVLTGAR